MSGYLGHEIRCCEEGVTTPYCGRTARRRVVQSFPGPLEVSRSRTTGTDRATRAKCLVSPDMLGTSRGRARKRELVLGTRDCSYVFSQAGIARVIAVVQCLRRERRIDSPCRSPSCGTRLGGLWAKNRLSIGARAVSPLGGVHGSIGRRPHAPLRG